MLLWNVEMDALKFPTTCPVVRISERILSSLTGGLTLHSGLHCSSVVSPLCVGTGRYFSLGLRLMIKMSGHIGFIFILFYFIV